MPSSSPTIRQRPFVELTTDELYEIIRLRVEVFVLEQDCPYQDLDGRDREPGTVHWWVEVDGVVASYLRVLRDADGTWRLGRVVTRPDSRSRGHSAVLIDSALATMGRPVLIHAQAHLADWYARFGFAVTGDEFLEDGIPHLPMALD
ncbi:MAG: GNAT family N-acetyltransferase [Acidimicrobiales bacterium]